MNQGKRLGGGFGFSWLYLLSVVMFLNKNTRIEECNDSLEILILLFVIKILVMRSSVVCRISNESLVKRGNVYQEVFVVVIRKQKKA